MAYAYFAFLDVMGYRYYLDKDKNDGTEIFKEKLISSYRAFEHIELGVLHHKSISDSIFMSSPNSIIDFLKTAKNVYLRFLENGLLIRGGIAYNKHYETQHITYSHALSDAYNLESSKAISPRILIHKAVVEKLVNESEGEAQSRELQLLLNEKLIIKCGNHFQLHVIDNDNWITIYENAKSIYLENETWINEDPKLFEYHNWLQNYLFNFPPKGNRKQKYIINFEILE